MRKMVRLQTIRIIGQIIEIVRDEALDVVYQGTSIERSGPRWRHPCATSWQGQSHSSDGPSRPWCKGGPDAKWWEHIPTWWHLHIPYQDSHHPIPGPPQRDWTIHQVHSSRENGQTAGIPGCTTAQGRRQHNQHFLFTARPPTPTSTCPYGHTIQQHTK